MISDAERARLQRLQRQLEDEDPTFVLTFMEHNRRLEASTARAMVDGAPQADVQLRRWLILFVASMAGAVVHPAVGLTAAAAVLLYLLWPDASSAAGTRGGRPEPHQPS